MKNIVESKSDITLKLKSDFKPKREEGIKNSMESNSNILSSSNTLNNIIIKSVNKIEDYNKNVNDVEENKNFELFEHNIRDEEVRRSL